MIRTIVTIDSPKSSVLRRKAKKVGDVTERTKALIADMVETMRKAPGVGLAAPQVGENLRIVVADADGRLIVLVDPDIVKKSEETAVASERCLSVPGVEGPVRRSTRVTVTGKNRRGKGVTIEAVGLLARVLQHEVDHLDGVLFLDRMEPSESAS